MITNPPIIIIRFLFVLKNKLNTFTDEPSMKNVVDIPIVKNKVFLNKELLMNLLLFRPSMLLLDNILKYIGNTGNIQGDKKDNTPSKNTTIKFNLSINSPPKLLF